MRARILAAVHRRDGGKMLTSLIRIRGFDRAEDTLQEAYAKALDAWASDGLPDNPAAWLTTVERNRLFDTLRIDNRIADERDTIIASVPANTVEVIGPSIVTDDQLRLTFTCCHPALAPSA
jgi:RNA polymerase sigma-70 factor (ECF subfamily)